MENIEKHPNSSIFCSQVISEIESSELNVYAKASLLNIMENLVQTEIKLSDIKEEDLPDFKLKKSEKIKFKDNDSLTIIINELKNHKNRWRAKVIHSCGNEVNDAISKVIFKIKPTEELLSLFLDILNFSYIMTYDDGIEQREKLIYSAEISNKEELGITDLNERELSILVGRDVINYLYNNIIEEAKKYGLDKNIEDKCSNTSILNRDFEAIKNIVNYDHNYYESENGCCEDCKERLECAIDNDSNNANNKLH